MQILLAGPSLSVVSNFVNTGARIYPNPANELLHIDNITANATYAILNMMGAVMRQGRLVNSNNSVDIATLASGVYVLELVSDGQRVVRKVVKE